MAQIGLKHLVIAPLATAVAGSAPTYTANGGIVAGNLMKADLSWNRGDVKLYGDDKLVARDNSITSGTLTVGTTYLSRNAKKMLLDIAESNTPGTGETQEYAMGGNASPYVGVGYVFKDLDPDTGTSKFIAYWYWKVQFSMNESAATKGESIEYGTPEIEGEIFAVQPLANLADKFRKEADFDTETAAITWLNTCASVPSSSGNT